MLNATEILLKAHNFTKLYRKLQNYVCSKYDISNVELDVLLFLNNNPGYDTAKDIVELRGIAKSYVSKAVDLLIKKELISAVADKNDKRIVHLKIEDKSKDIIEDGRVGQDNFLDIIYKDISNEERENLQKTLDKITRNIREVL